MEQVEIERLIGELEIAVDRLRSLYDQYFMGIEKLEPTVPRKDVDRRIHVLRKEQIRNTALRFRFHMLLQRYNTYQTHWQRICRDIENGTYKRHVIRAQQRFGPRAGRRSSRPPREDPAKAAEWAELEQEFAPAETLDDRDFLVEEEAPPTRRAGGSIRPPASRPGPVTPRTPQPPRTHPPPRSPASPRTPPPPLRTPPPPKTPPPPTRGAAPAKTPPPARPSTRSMPPAGRGAPPKAPPPSSRSVVSSKPVRPPSTPRVVAAARPAHAGSPPSDLPDARVRQLYAQYVETKRRQNESTASITYEAVARSLQESSAKLRQKLGRSVDFEVVVKDGRAVLRPVVK